MANYKRRYEQFKAEVDQEVGRPLGRGGKFKAFFGSFSDQRKAAITKIFNAHEALAQNLYQSEHIIGTTGKAGQLPTVYYRRPSGTFGHITQEHGEAGNVGRMKTRKADDYKIDNTGKKGTMEEESRKLNFYHPSRNPIKWKDQLTPVELHDANQVHQTIRNFKAGGYL